MQRQEKLPVRETRGQQMSGVHRERGLADPGHPVNGMNVHDACGARLSFQLPHQPLKLRHAASEASRVARQRVDGRNRRQRDTSPSKPRITSVQERVGRRYVATCSRLEERAGRSSQAQRIC